VTTPDQAAQSSRGTTRRRSRASSFRQQWTWYLFIAPNVLLFLVFTLFTWGFLLFLSFNNWSLIGARSLIGLDNYARALGDEVFWIALRNTAVYAILVVLPVSALALLLAVLVNQRIPFVGVFRSAYYLPVVTSISVIAIIWAFTFVPRPDGPANYLIGLVGIPPQDWLIDPDQALPTVAMMGIWSIAGYYMVLWLAGLQNVPEELEEAARIDGANRWQVFWNVTLPLLKPTTIFILMIATIGALQVFGAAYVLTGGGPLRATTTIVYYIWLAAFGTYQMGYGASVSVILFAIVLGIALLQRRLLRWNEELY
jgi:ABC-type sugar transport system permease subunit